MPFPKAFISTALLFLLCACGPSTSSDNGENELMATGEDLYEEQVTKSREDVGLKMIALKARLADLETDYDSVASGETDKTEQRAGGTQRMDDLPERGANVGQSFDSITAVNRDLLGGAAKMEADSEDLELMANARINEARAALATARAENEWTDEEVKTYETPILAAEKALDELETSRKTLKETYSNGENFIEMKRKETADDPSKL